MDFGLSTRLFHSEPLGPAHVEAAAAHGFTALELFALRTHADYHAPATGRDLATWCANAGVRLHSVHAPVADSVTDTPTGAAWAGVLSSAAAQASARDRAIDAYARVLGLAEQVPYACLVLHLGVPDALATMENQRDGALRTLEAVLPMAQRAGVDLALEVIPNGLSSARQLVRLLDDEDLPGVGIGFDVGHAHLMGDVADALDLAGGYVITVDVHDTRGRHDDHRVPLDGTVDWPGVCAGLQKIGYDGVLTFELAADGDALATLARAGAARQRLEQWLGADSFGFVDE